MAGQVTVSAGSDLQLVVFELANESYGIEIASIQEIIVIQDITTIPRAPDFIEGVINLRGRVVPVVDLRKSFGMPIAPRTRSTRIVVVVVNDQTLGLVVDAVSQVLTVDRSHVEPPSPIVANVNTDYIRGIAKLPDKMVIWLDLARVLTAGQRGELETFGAEAPVEAAAGADR